MTSLPTSNPADFSSGTQSSPFCDYNDSMIFTVFPTYVKVVCVLGITMNVFVLLVFCLHKKPCTVPEIYLCNLAAADLLLTAFFLVLVKNIDNLFMWPVSDFLCKLIDAAITMNVSCSIYFLVMISFDRYLALVHPLSHGYMRRPCTAKLGCFVVWVLGLVLACPVIIYSKVERFHDVGICMFTVPHPFLYSTLMIILKFLIPMSLLLFFSVKILKAFRNRLSTSMSSNPQAKEQKATAMVLSVLLAFLICWVPYHITTILAMLVHLKIVRGCQFAINLDLCSYIFSCLALLHSILNPILYVIVGKNFQKKAKELFKCPSRNDNTRVTPRCSAGWHICDIMGCSSP